MSVKLQWKCLLLCSITLQFFRLSFHDQKHFWDQSVVYNIPLNFFFYCNPGISPKWMQRQSLKRNSEISNNSLNTDRNKLNLIPPLMKQIFNVWKIIRDLLIPSVNIFTLSTERMIRLFYHFWVPPLGKDSKHSTKTYKTCWTKIRF